MILTAAHILWDFISGVVFLAAQCALVFLLLGAVFFRSAADGLSVPVSRTGRVVIGLAVATCLLTGAFHLVVKPLRAAIAPPEPPASLVRAAFEGRPMIVRLHDEACAQAKMRQADIPCGADLSGRFDHHSARWTFDLPAANGRPSRRTSDRIRLRILGLMAIGGIPFQFDDTGRLYLDRDEAGTVRIEARAP